MIRFPQLKTIFLSLLLALSLATLAILSVTFLILSNFSRQTGNSPWYYLSTFKSSLFPSAKTIARQNFIILGLEKRDDWLEKTESTDTIIFASLEFKTGRLYLVSLPRDLWYHPFSSKINNIYPASKINNQANFDYLKSAFSDLTHQPIDHVIILETKNLETLLSLVGGVDVYLDQGFKDTSYPNPAYITQPSKNTPIYITVEYPSGWNHINQSNLAPFVRSRKSSDTASSGGTDLGRIKRQQLLIEAILGKLKSRQFIFNISNLATLYNFFHHDLVHTLNDQDLLTAALHANLSNLTIRKIDLPVGQTARDGLIYYPGQPYQGQWVFLPSDPSYQDLQSFIHSSIYAL
ncbi:MAG: LCP family protein [Candidatus Shapirobacteria bacterium]|jgi:LCP family protein required for cell wall assembly